MSNNSLNLVRTALERANMQLVAYGANNTTFIRDAITELNLMGEAAPKLADASVDASEVQRSAVCTMEETSPANHTLIDFIQHHLKQSDVLTGLWKCSHCDNVEAKEREVLCWKCGEGQMVYIPTSRDLLRQALPFLQQRDVSAECLTCKGTGCPDCGYPDRREAIRSEIRLLTPALKADIADNIDPENRTATDLVQDVWDELMQRGLIAQPVRELRDRGALKAIFDIATNDTKQSQVDDLAEISEIASSALNSIEDGNAHD